MDKKKGVTWTYFRVEDKKVICKYCSKLYKHANVNKMERHIKKCFKCPEDFKKVFSGGTASLIKAPKSKSVVPQPQTNIVNQEIVDVDITDLTEAEPALAFSVTASSLQSPKTSKPLETSDKVASPSNSLSSTTPLSSVSIVNRPESRISTYTPNKSVLNFIDTMDDRQNVSCVI